jgi:hypothetical protein
MSKTKAKLEEAKQQVARVQAILVRALRMENPKDIRHEVRRALEALRS